MIQELDRRESNGIAVALQWDSETNEVIVDVEDRTGEKFTLAPVPHDKAHDVFNHPYVYERELRR